MKNRLSRAALALAAVCAGVSLASAANPTFWQVSNEAEFSKGDVENLSIDGYGRLTLGPSTTSIYDASAPFLWSMISAPDGSTYVGSGNEGQIYRIDSSGKIVFQRSGGVDSADEVADLVREHLDVNL